MDHGLDCINSSFIILNFLLLTDKLNKFIYVLALYMTILIGFHLA